MHERNPLNYLDVQRIKAEEYDRFFAHLPSYHLYMNHLGEVKWMKEQDALNQHEFFLYKESYWERLKRRFRLRKKIRLEKLPVPEREIRLKLRQFLEETYLGRVRSRTKKYIPEQWQYDIDINELRSVPLTLGFFSGIDILKRLLPLFAGLLLIVLILYYKIGGFDAPPTGKLLVRTEVTGGRVYMDKSKFLGYTNRIIRGIPAGIHRISVIKEGYHPIPSYHEVDIVRDSVITLDFQMNITRSEFMGYLKIISDQSDSRIMVDDVFYGMLEDESILALEEGQYEINVEKDGYVAIPAEKIVRISSGDTSLLRVQQIPLKSGGGNYQAGQAGDIGSLDISSDVKGAKIYINGKDTGERTDHIFTQLPLGHYVIQLNEEGYRIEPSAVEVNLTRAEPAKNASFDLTRTSEIVRIRTTPVEGKIYVDGQFKSQGSFEAVLSVGEHTVTFGEVEGFKTPVGKEISVKPGFPVNLDVSYFPDLKIQAGVNERGAIYQKNCEVLTGYTFRERAFAASEEAGPSIEFNEQLNDYFWKLGYAYPYRNPKGNDAIKLVFELPQNLDYKQSFTLKLSAAASHEKYPLSLSGTTDIIIKFNNSILSYYYEPDFIEDQNSMKPEEWDITPQIRGGTNVLEIATSDKNNTYYYVKKIEIVN